MEARPLHPPLRAANPGAAPPEVRIQLLGGFRVAVGARAVPDAAWRLRTARSLVKVLALAPGHALHREQVVDLLWPDRGPEVPPSNLRHTIYVARRALQVTGDLPASPLVLQGDQVALRPE